MKTLDAPVYQVKQDSDWYKSVIKQKEEVRAFFKDFKDKYGVREGFGFYHTEYFGAHKGTEAYDFFKDEVLKNPTKDGFYAFKKRSKYFKEIKEMLEKIELSDPFKSHDVLGLNNVSASQWLGDKWFFQVKDENLVKSDEVVPVDFKEYLAVVMDKLD